jgi:hypothetical protein
MDATRNPLQQTEVVDQVVKQLAVSVTKEQRIAEPVVKSTTVLKTISEPALKTAVDQLTKVFETFSVNLL